MQCVECHSLMEPREGMWVCDTCFNAVPGETMGDDTVLEDGMTLRDVLGRQEDEK